MGSLAEGESYTVLEAVTDDLGTRRVLIRSAGGTEGWIRERGPESEPGEPAPGPRESVAKWLALVEAQLDPLPTAGDADIVDV